jgi:hypothetical protein
MKSVVIIILMLFSLQLKAQFSDYIVLVGPKFNFNFGNGQHRFSGGLEVSAWTFNNESIPFGADFGFEFERDRCRIYSELQAGMILGLSAGPVLELTRDTQTLGFQGSAWTAIFLAVDMRYRRINATNYFAPGIFFKYPVFEKGNFDIF